MTQSTYIKPKRGRPRLGGLTKKRVAIDVTETHKNFIRKAACMRGMSLVAFITNATIQACERTLNQNFSEFYKTETEKKAILQPFTDKQS